MLVGQVLATREICFGVGECRTSRIIMNNTRCRTCFTFCQSSCFQNSKVPQKLSLMSSQQVDAFGSSLAARNAVAVELCVTPGCTYAAHPDRAKFKGFCCSRCFEYHGLHNGKVPHGRCCEGKAGTGPRLTYQGEPKRIFTWARDRQSWCTIEEC